MITETPFEQLAESEQNSLLATLAKQIRPMLGEIGEVVITEHNNKRSGFIGLVFRHGTDKAVVFAEYADEPTRKKWRSEHYSVGKHVFSISDPYISEIIKAGTKTLDDRMGASDALSLMNVSNECNSAAETFVGCYGEEAEQPNFKIKLLGKPLKKVNGQTDSMLYFAFKEGDDINGVTGLIDQLSKLVEQLIRNALGLAAISNQKLRGAVSYLTYQLPQSFNDYVRPQVLAAIYAYVREIVPCAMPAPDGELASTDKATPTSLLPVVNPSDSELAIPLKSIQTASLIQINREVDGSLKGASVLSLSITTKAAHEGGTTTYPAIAKFSTLAEARNEADGLRRMQRYYSSIGKMLPPSLEVYLIADSEGKLPFEKKGWDGRWTELACISVTPDLEGAVLSEKIAEHWASPTRRVERFSGYLQSARTFVEKIQQQPFECSMTPTGSGAATPAREEPKNYLVDFFSESKSVRQRFDLLAAGFNFPEGKVLKIKMADCGEISVVNPAAWIGEMLKDSSLVQWKQQPSRERKQVWTHGDFHTGNLFLSTVGEHLTVLDYDRVSPGGMEEDLARLEGSFAAFVFALPDLNQADNWVAYAPPSLALLAGCHPSAFHLLQQNIFARDLLETLNVIRPAKPCPFYTALVIKALLIQLKTYCTTREIEGKVALLDEDKLKANQSRNAATWLYLGMLLGQLVETKDTPVDWTKPFNSGLPKA